MIINPQSIQFIIGEPYQSSLLFNAPEGRGDIKLIITNIVIFI